MANFVYKSLLKAEIEKFIHEFSVSSKEVYYDEAMRKIFHNGEYGKHRENIVKNFLRFLIPRRLDINSGFILTTKNEVSTECDVVIYDHNSTPLIQDSDKQNFYPVEVVAAIGEVKSTLTKYELKQALNKLAKNKALRQSIIMPPSIVRRETINEIDLKTQPYDNIFTFLICEKLDFAFENFHINELYDTSVESHFRHNIVLSIQDGIFLYRDNYYGEFKDGPYPTKEGASIYLPFDAQKLHLFEVFAHYMFLGTSSSTIFYPDLILYLIEKIKK